MDHIVGHLKVIESVTGKLLSSPSISGTLSDEGGTTLILPHVLIKENSNDK